MTQTGGQAEPTILQSLIWPERGICTERDLYVRLRGPAGLNEEDRRLVLREGGQLGFDTWFNLFNLGKWRRHCDLRDLSLRLEGQGECAVSVMLALSDRSWERVSEQVVTLGQGTDLDLSGIFDEKMSNAVLYFEITALGPMELTGAHWMTRQPPLRAPDLMLSVTTFRREAAVERTAARFEAYIAASGMAGRIRMTVVDNGQSANIPPSDNVTLIPNENLGGAGGFSRGLLAARDTGASHCLFMDDDASIHMESLTRTWTFLAYATDPATAVAGAMINATHRWAIWENGALFHTRCKPLHMGTDLRDPGATIRMEFETTPDPDAGFYGGWWYFAFPVDEVRHQPFPFFVRGDDVSFSLVHDFNIVTLNGVVSYQDSFTDKESPLTWYLDLRSHLAHHLSLPELEIGRWKTWNIALWFFLRNLPRMHYETLTGINMALEDVIKGPGFFDANADMSARRADFKALTVNEAWRETPPELQRSEIANLRRNPPRPWRRNLMKLTMNGHLIPFFNRIGKKIVLTSENRGSLGHVWAASEITYLSADRKQYYKVIHSKARLFSEIGRFIRVSWQFLRLYPELLETWRGGYRTLTGETYWRGKLHLTADVAEAPVPSSAAS
jgi:hypothetical protein